MAFKNPELMKRAAKDALAVQSACNLSGVVHAFARAMTTLGDEGYDTDRKNRHPIAQLFAVQIAHLTGVPCDVFDGYWEASKACEAIAKGDEPATKRDVSMDIPDARR